jgi:hypothetical protein
MDKRGFDDQDLHVSVFHLFFIFWQKRDQDRMKKTIAMHILCHIFHVISNIRSANVGSGSLYCAHDFGLSRLRSCFPLIRLLGSAKTPTLRRNVPLVCVALVLSINDSTYHSVNLASMVAGTLTMCFSLRTWRLHNDNPLQTCHDHSTMSLSPQRSSTQVSNTSSSKPRISPGCCLYIIISGWTVLILGLAAFLLYKVGQEVQNLSGSWRGPIRNTVFIPLFGWFGVYQRSEDGYGASCVRPTKTVDQVSFW